MAKQMRIRIQALDLEHPKPTSPDAGVQLLISILTGTPIAITNTITEILVGKQSFPSRS